MSRSSNLTVGEAEVALRAYQIWEAEGKPADKDFDHWLRAKADRVPGSGVRAAGSP